MEHLLHLHSSVGAYWGYLPLVARPAGMVLTAHHSRRRRRIAR